MSHLPAVPTQEQEQHTQLSERSNRVTSLFFLCICSRCPSRVSVNQSYAVIPWERHTTWLVLVCLAVGRLFHPADSRRTIVAMHTVPIIPPHLSLMPSSSPS